MKDGKAVPVKVEECLICRSCESQCPEGAIQVIEIEPAKVEPPKLEEAKKKVKKIAKNKTSPRSAKLRKKLL
jgi:Fe-S-cluster-containing hydrogenase component 2